MRMRLGRLRVFGWPAGRGWLRWPLSHGSIWWDGDVLIEW
jgi:hypothetical protein